MRGWTFLAGFQLTLALEIIYQNKITTENTLENFKIIMLNGDIQRIIFVAPHHEEDVSGIIELKNRIDVLFYK